MSPIVRRSLARIKTASQTIARVQSKCSHKKVEKKHRGDTGNYDPSNDRYWTEMYCPTCDKRWTVEGSV